MKPDSPIVKSLIVWSSFSLVRRVGALTSAALVSHDDAMRMLLVMLAGIATSWAEEPKKLTELRKIFEDEQARIMVPLLEKYSQALQAQEKAATRKGDLDGGIAFRNERVSVEKRIASLKPKKPELPEENSPAQEPKDAKEDRPVTIPSVLTADNKSTTRIWHDRRGMKATKPFRTLVVHGIAEGETQGDVVLILPSGKEVLIYSWTGNEREFRHSNKVRPNYWDEIKRSLKIDISDHAKEEGNYTVAFVYKSGAGAFLLYSARMDH